MCAMKAVKNLIHFLYFRLMKMLCHRAQHAYYVFVPRVADGTFRNTAKIKTLNGPRNSPRPRRSSLNVPLWSHLQQPTNQPTTGT